MRALARYLSLVRFSHSVFALPFALQGAWMAARGAPRLATLGWIVLCAVAARTSAMAFNRLVDRAIDARNPRTRGRELPSGALSPRSAALLVLVSATVFVGGAFALNPLCGWLSFPVLGVLLGYSYVKRFSFLAHAVLGLALALAPLGAWLAVRGEIAGDLAPVLALALGVLAWVTGFDLIYACQDVDFDREAGLHSVPARLGVARALWISRCLHAFALACFVAQGLAAGLGAFWWIGVIAAALLLAWEHRLVAPTDLSRVDAAFFTANGWLGIALFLGLVLDLSSRGGGA